MAYRSGLCGAGQVICSHVSQRSRHTIVPSNGSREHSCVYTAHELSPVVCVQDAMSILSIHCGHLSPVMAHT